MSTPLLALQGVTRRFGGLVAVTNLSFSIRAGEVVGIIGPNGAGKTTALNMIAGAIRPTNGMIWFDGKDVTGWPPHLLSRAGITRTFQLTKPFPEMSVRENVLVGLLHAGIERNEAVRIADKHLGEVDLLAHAGERAGALNNAMRKRLELVRALAPKPRLLLADESLAGLTRSEIDRVLSILRAAAADGTAIIMVEHVLHGLFAIAERVLVLDQGELLAQGRPSDVVNDPLVVAAYLGDAFARA
jgi:branched-chain amino acid transport system ATP-binding protein